MATIAAGRGRHRHFEAWPGYVDVLSTLLMVVIFVLMVFLIAQVFLSHALTTSDQALMEKKQELQLKDTTIEQLRRDVHDLATQLQGATKARDDAQQRMTVILAERDSLAAGLADANSQLAKADDKAASLEAQIQQLLKAGESDKAALATTRAELDKAYKLSDENKAALLAALADVEAGKKSAAETKVALEAALAAARAEAEKAGKLTAEQKAALDQKLAELENAYKTIDADKEKIQTTLAELAALQKARDDLARSM